MKKIFVLKQILVLSNALLFFTHYAQAQNIFPSVGSAGIGTTTPNASSILEMVSTSKGMLVPRMTKNRRDSIATPATGLLIYQTNSTPGFYYYNGSQWTALSGWSLRGNAGINAATNFLGTTDNKELVFRTNNTEQMRISTSGKVGIGITAPLQRLDVNGNINIAPGSGIYFANTKIIHTTGTDNFFAGQNNGASIGTGAENTALGMGAMAAIATGSYNTATGERSLNTNNGSYNTASGANTMATTSNPLASYNTAFGSLALGNNGGNNNTACGFNALNFNGTGYSNTAMGTNALRLNTAGHNLVAVGDSALFSQGVNGFDEYANTAIGSKSLYSNTVGSFNTAVGSRALYANMGGTENTANGVYALTANINGAENTATGTDALLSNTYGSSNTATGGYALSANTLGSFNTAIGVRSLYNTTIGYGNTAVGTDALFHNTTGRNSVAAGDSALYNNTADLITAVGLKAGFNNTVGVENSYWGTQAGYANSSGSYNNYLGYMAGPKATGNSNNFLGANAGANTVSGSYNTFIGDVAGKSNIGTGNTYVGAGSGGASANKNSTAIGWNAIATASDQVMLGNTSVTSVIAAGSFVIYSDGRFKKNVKDDVPGLSFISQLKPVTYNYDIHGLNTHINGNSTNNNNIRASDASKQQNEDAINTKEKIKYTGFIAQDVEAAAKKLNYDFSGVYKPQNEHDAYGLSYADFVVPLVKAVQELSSQNDLLKQNNQSLNDELNSLSDKINQMENALRQCCSSFSSDIQSVVTNQSPVKKADAAGLDQNVPNPFNESTSIHYTLPSKFSSAQIVITDYSGKVLKQVSISKAGKGVLNVDAGTLTSGAYSYSLLVDGKLIDTKRMVLAK